MYDVVVVGSGAAGIMAAITSAKSGKKVLLLEQLSKIASKLKATGGGRCNITNTLELNPFMEKFGKNGRFMQDALKAFSANDLQEFLAKIGVETIARDGFRVFPTTHKSTTLIDALYDEMVKCDVKIQTNQKVSSIKKEDEYFVITTNSDIFSSNNIILATGGLGYETLGATGEGFEISKNFGHKVSKLYPAMMPLSTKEDWVAKCTADTIAKVQMYVDIKKYKKIKATGDLIFTKKGIRGPVVLDFAREITPLFDKLDEIPLKMNLIKGKNENDIIELFKNNPSKTILETLLEVLPQSVITQLADIADVDINKKYKNIEGVKKQPFISLLTNTPLTISGHDGFKMAMITRGGISLKEIDPRTMQSKIVDGIYFAGEIVDIDGPCGGYNLQWSFSSGYLAGLLKN
jgi:predicted Rossmann fold flavoprotein